MAGLGAEVLQALAADASHANRPYSPDVRRRRQASDTLRAADRPAIRSAGAGGPATAAGSGRRPARQLSRVSWGSVARAGFPVLWSGIPCAVIAKMTGSPAAVIHGVSAPVPEPDPFRPRSAGTMSIRKLLVANRGEIAIRVMRAAAEMGIRT
ncbi:MAG: biotin carboxylase N-terminal domain-containing protein, partial [Neoaquamicrobium sediminum]